MLDYAVGNAEDRITYLFLKVTASTKKNPFYKFVLYNKVGVQTSINKTLINLGSSYLKTLITVLTFTNE